MRLRVTSSQARAKPIGRRHAVDVNASGWLDPQFGVSTLKEDRQRAVLVENADLVPLCVGHVGLIHARVDTHGRAMARGEVEDASDGRRLTGCAKHSNEVAQATLRM